MDFSPPVVEWLKHRRKLLDLTQRGLARRANFSLAAIRQIEEGSRIASRNLAEALAIALEIPAEDREAFIAFVRGTAGQHPLNHLPVPLTPLLGREGALAAVKRALMEEGARLITLLGPPGVGKTRLALQVARELQPILAGGATFVSLAPVGDPALIPAAIAAALQNRAIGADASIEAVGRFIDARPMLLVMDNFEHLLAGASVINTLLGSCPGLRALATSRELLNLFGEQVIEVAPLDEAPACALFVRHAAAAKPGFALSPENAPVITEICRKLDGLPLAIELAAARARMLTPGKMLARLNHHSGAQLELLTTGPRDWPARQQTLRATIDWSYALLNSDEQSFFRRMGVFSGGCAFEMARAVCGDSGDGTSRDEASTESRLQSLLDKSLIKETLGLDGAPRLELLETLREYAVLRLEDSGEGPATRGRMAAYLAQLARSMQPYSFHPDHIGRLRRMAVERDNIRAALNWSRGPGGDYSAGLQLAGLTGWVVSWGGYLKVYLPPAEISAWMTDIDLRIRGVNPADQTSVLFGLTDLTMSLGDPDAWRRMVALIEDSARRSGETVDRCLAGFARILAEHCMTGDFARGEPHYEALLVLSESDPDWRAFAQNLYGRALVLNGQPDRAIGLISAARAHWEARGMVWAPHGGTATTRMYLAMAHIARDEYARAQTLAEQAADDNARGGWRPGEAVGARFAALAAAAAGQAEAFCADAARHLRIWPNVPREVTRHPMSRHMSPGEARVLLRCAAWALTRQRETLPGHVWPLLLVVLGGIMNGVGGASAGAYLFGAADGLLARANGLPADSPFRVLVEQQQANARTFWAADLALTLAWETGANSSLDDVTAFVRALEPPREPNQAPLFDNKTPEGQVDPSG